MSKLLKVALLSSVSIVTLYSSNIKADELLELNDGSQVAKKSVEHNASITVGPFVTNLGAELKSVETNEFSDDKGDRETTTEAEISIKPMVVRSQDGMSFQGKVIINPFGTTSQKLFMGDNEDSIRPFLHGQSSGLKYSSEGVDGSRSFTLLELQNGLGVDIGLGERSNVSVFGGLLAGAEFGKRKGILDVGVYGGSELNINDVVNISGDATFRSSLFGSGYELIQSGEASVKIADSLRFGLEAETTRNLLGNGQKYDTNYMGVKIGGTWGKKSSSR